MFSGDSSGIVRRFDGAAWTSLPGLGARISGLWGTDPTNVWALLATGNAANWNGTAWTTMSTGVPLVAMSGTAANDIFAVGVNGSSSVIRRYDGVAWTAMTHPTAGFLRDVWAAAPDDVWAVGEAGKILHYDGSAWTVVPSGTSATLFGVHGTATDDVWAVGANGTILQYDGVSWTPVRSPSEVSYTDVAVRDRLVVLGAGGAGTIALIRERSW
jgi:hypothetical protein